MIGQTISHYKILEKLGEGGMGVVYKAQDTKLDRIVALKFLPHHLTTRKEERERFLQEAKAASALNHPNVCTIHDIQEHDGQLFIVMEFIPGDNLRAMMNSGPMDAPVAINVALCVAEGLRAAHKKSLVHGDIKPENIIIADDGVAKIADFGLARMSDQTEIEKPNSIPGTLAYMSPEQMNGEITNHLTDIWSLGIVLYEMVTGQRPFTGDYNEALMYSILHEKHRPVSELRSNLPPALGKIIDRCLEKVPQIRFPDAGTLAQELRLIELEPRTPGTLPTKSIAVLPFADISPDKSNEYFSDGLTEEIITSLSKLRSVRVVSRSSIVHYEHGGKTMKQIADELGVQYVLEGSVRKSGSALRITTQLIDANQDAYLWAETYNGTMDDVFEIQENVAGRIVKALKMRLTPAEKRNLKRRATENTEAYQLYLKGRFFWNKRSMDGLRKAIRYFEDAIKKDAQYALAWAGIADSYALLGDYGGVSRKEIYPKAKAAVHKALELDDKLAEAHTSLALFLMLNDLDWINSEKEFKKAIRLNPHYPTAHHWYAQWLMFQGKLREAIDVISSAIELDPFSSAIVKDKGLAFYYARDYDSAIEYANKALELDPSFAVAYRLLSLSHQAKGAFTEAIAENQLWAEDAGNELEGSIALAQIYAAAGRTTEALDRLRLLSVQQSPSGNFMRGMALCYAALGEIDLAFTWLEKAYESKAEALCTLRIDPKLDGLRGDPRFHALLKKVGLEE